MLATARAVRVLGTPGVQQCAQRMVLRAAIDAEVFAALTALEQRVLAAAGSTWMLRAPAVQQRTRIARRRSTVLAVFTHVAYYSIISGLCGKRHFHITLSCGVVRRSSKGRGCCGGSDLHQSVAARVRCTDRRSRLVRSGHRDR